MGFQWAQLDSRPHLQGDCWPVGPALTRSVDSPNMVRSRMWGSSAAGGGPRGAYPREDLGATHWTVEISRTFSTRRQHGESHGLSSVVLFSIYLTDLLNIKYRAVRARTGNPIFVPYQRSNGPRLVSTSGIRRGQI